MSVCTDTEADPWGDGVHACVLPATHVFADRVPDEMDPRAHRCSCRTWWYDRQQIVEARERVP